MTKDAAERIIAEKLSEAHDLIKECENLADEHNTSFDFSVAYGSGATYYGKPKKNKVKSDALAKLTDEEKEALGLSDVDPDEEWSSSDAGWMSSSAQC